MRFCCGSISVVPRSEVTLLWTGLGIVLVTKLPIFQQFRIGHGLWRFATVADVRGIFMANLVGSILSSAAIYVADRSALPQIRVFHGFYLVFLWLLQAAGYPSGCTTRHCSTAAAVNTATIPSVRSRHHGVDTGAGNPRQSQPETARGWGSSMMIGASGRLY